MAERGFDETHGHTRDGAGDGPVGAPFPGGPFAPPGAGPMGDWLQEAAAWAGPPPAPHPWAGPPAGPQPWAAPSAGGVPGPWVAPPPLEREEPRSRWSAGGVAPWVVAGLLCAYLLAGRGAPPPPAPVADPAGLPAATSAPQPVETAAAQGLQPVTACPGVAP